MFGLSNHISFRTTPGLKGKFDSQYLEILVLESRHNYLSIGPSWFADKQKKSVKSSYSAFINIDSKHNTKSNHNMKIKCNKAI